MPDIKSIAGRAGVDRSNRNTNSELERMKRKLLGLPDIALKAVIRGVYPTIVRETVQDSGKAAYNWWIGEGKASMNRFYVGDSVGPIGFAGEKRSKGGPRHKPVNVSTVSPEVIVGLKISYMEKVLETTSFDRLGGATIYNKTPVKNADTFKGTYEGNAQIRLAVAKAMVNAQGAMDMAMREFN